MQSSTESYTAPRRVVRELDLIRETAGQAGVRRQEQRHLLAVPGQDHHQVIAVVLNTLYQGVNGFQPKAVLAAAVQAVCFINEQHAAQALWITWLVSGAVWPT